jgi:hypothetical protein
VTDAVLIPSAQSEALLREIKRQTQAEGRAVTENAERDAGAIVTRAHVDARGRMHEAIAALRQEKRRRLVRANAQADTEARGQAHRRAGETIQAAWPLLEKALAERWKDPASRRQWVEGAARQAAARLQQGRWRVEHPSDWSASEQKTFRKILADRTEVEIEFTVDADLNEGLRIRASHAVLDATPLGLTADRMAVAALLLAEVERSGT